MATPLRRYISCLSFAHDVSLLLRCIDINGHNTLKPAFHDADTDADILARILADKSDTRSIS